ncbi:MULTISPECIES: hypothetical protein [unclassified Synechococcus]|uniref:hypothetical protein n=1 Tax=unclassified Synechococcus TaxID=2626047 RepID=UPI0012E92DF3|nr:MULTISPECIES: hypothetical protein [unclassified Synechococcus]
MARALMLPKKWNKLEVQSSIAFLLGSILFVAGSITELHNQWIFKTLFMLGSVLFLTGSLTQLWQTFRAWRRKKSTF